MKHPLSQSASLALGGLLVVSVAVSTTSAQAPTSVISSHTTEVDGLKLHYPTAGHGAAVILLHGYAETSRMWKPIMPRLSERFTVIAPDLPGIGDSAIPADGLDMKTAAIRMHALVTYSAPGLMGAGWAYFVCSPRPPPISHNSLKPSSACRFWRSQARSPWGVYWAKGDRHERTPIPRLPLTPRRAGQPALRYDGYRRAGTEGRWRNAS